MPLLRDMLTPEVADGLERYRDSLEVPESVPLALNRILRDWLTGHGYMETVDVPEGEDDPDA